MDPTNPDLDADPEDCFKMISLGFLLWTPDDLNMYGGE
jgi:hypothetical protein